MSANETSELDKQQRKERRSRIISWLVVGAILFGLWYFVFPPVLGGRTTLLTTKGVSMQPLLYQGDLAILRKQSTYKVGDVVQYQSKALNAPVLHRVIAVENGAYSTQGDNNNFVDLDKPRAKEINGKMIQHFSGWGDKVGWLKSLPARIIGALLVGFAVYSLFANKNDPKNEKKRRGRVPIGRKRQTREELDSEMVAQHLQSIGVAHAPQGPPGEDAEQTSLDESASLESVPGEDGAKAEGGLPGGEPPKVGSTVDKVKSLGSAQPRRELVSRLGLGAFGLLAAVSLVFAVVAFGHPASQDKDQLVIYNMTGSFNYSAPATGGDVVYRNGRVQTGDPIYLAMVEELSVTFDYRLDSMSKFNGDGTIKFDAFLQGASGWSHPIGTMDTAEYSTDTGRATALIDLRGLKDIIRQVAELTRVNDNSFTLSLRPTVTADGTLGGQKFDETFQPKLDLSLNNSLIKPPSDGPVEADGGPGGPEGLNNSNDRLSGLKVSKGGQLTIAAGTPQHLKTLGVSLAVMTLRLISVGGLLIGVLGVAFCLRRRRGLVVVDEQGARSDPLAKHVMEVNSHKSLVVPVSGLDEAAAATTVVEVQSLSDLAKIADNHESLLFQEVQDGKETYLVSQGAVSYRYVFNTGKHVGAPISESAGQPVAGQSAESASQSAGLVVDSAENKGAENRVQIGSAERREKAQDPNRRFRVRSEDNQPSSTASPGDHSELAEDAKPAPSPTKAATATATEVSKSTKTASATKAAKATGAAKSTRSTKAATAKKPAASKRTAAKPPEEQSAAAKPVPKSEDKSAEETGAVSEAPKAPAKKRARKPKAVPEQQDRASAKDEQ